MGTKIFIVRYVLLFTLVITLVACVSSRGYRDAGTYVGSAIITAKIKALYAHDDLLKSCTISVETYDGVVHLEGSVDSRKTKKRAGQIAKGVQGVKSVKNNLKKK